MSTISRMMAATAIGTVLAGAVLNAAAQQQSTAAQLKDSPTELGSYLCKDVMRMSGDDRVIALSVLHGYFLGKKGAMSYVSAALAKVTDEFTDYCLDNPNAKALDAFGKFAK